MVLIAFFFIVALVTSWSVAQAEDADPCLVSTVHNISHINERYAKLKDVCPYTDHRIVRTWFYAGEDPIVTFPPNYCRCGYKFPIWMNGTLPNPEDGIVNRTACLKFLQPCHRELNIQIRNCRTFFLYRLTPGPDDSGYCFGIDKPEPNKKPAENNIPSATVTIQENTVTENGFISRINISANNEEFNGTIELAISDGFVLQAIVLHESSIDYRWENLSSATNYTIRIFAYNNGESTEIASAWVVTKIPYRPASANINVLKNTITNSTFSVAFTFDHGSENTTGECNVLLQDGSVLLSLRLENSITLSFNDLNYGTLYTIEVHMYRNGTRIRLAQELVFTQPEIEVSLESKLVAEKYLSFTVFECKFNSSLETSYGVQWFVQSKERNHTIFKTVDVGEGIQKLYLTEDDLVNNHISLPFYVSCAVSGVLRVLKSDFSPSSESLFAGIKILTPRITMHRNETAAILFTPSIPFGCLSLQKTAVDRCNLTLAITIPVSNNCRGMSTRKCTIHIQGKPGSTNSLQIQATEDGQYGIQKDSTHKVILRTVHLSNATIWNDYTLPAVTVVVKPEKETYWRGKVCEALNDPHMFTFDKRAYEHHESLSDEYVLYTHELYSTKIHHKLERCNSNAMCNCGVAVQAGRDLYLISTCNNIIEIGYKQCDDGVLLVKQETDSVYTIYLPYGTYVKARLDKSPYSGGSMIVSVSVFPSVHDQNGRSKGLCGTLDNAQANDFHDRSGQTGLNRTDFILAWKVSETESLFVAKTKSNSPWKHPACACKVSNGHVTSDDKCQLGADNSCTKGKTVGQQVCKLAERIPIISQNGFNVPALNLSKENNPQRHNKTSTPATIKHWNSVEANTFCTAFLNKSRTYRLCKRVPYTDTDRAIETCTQDIIITQTTEWHKLSRQSMQDACLSEIHRNKTVREHLETPKITVSPPTPPSGQHIGKVTPPKPTESTIDSNLDIYELIDKIEEIACPNECSENGLCKNGTCRCYNGFGGDDCSIDFKKAPSATNFLHGSVCDEKETPCTHVFIHGGFFASETVSCHITTFETHAGKKGRQNLDAYVIRGQTQSLIEVICPLTTPLRRRRSIPDTIDAKLLSCYKVAVSNDGIHHGSPITMCVYNSQCQSLFNDTDGLLTASIKNGFCYIEGKCVQANARQSSLGTYCIPALSLYSWSEFPTTTVTSSTRATSALGVLIIHHAENNWQTPVIIAVACICCLIVIVGIVVFIRKKKRRKTKDNSKENDALELSKQHDADFDDETYAYINPTDVSDQVSHGQKTLNQTSDTSNDYYRLDISSKEKVQYDRLNSLQNSRNEDGPMLPDRPVANLGDPYEKLRTQTREQRVYEKMGISSRNIEIVGEPISSRENRNPSDQKHSVIILQDNQENYLNPGEEFDEATLTIKRNQSERGPRNDDFLEGYERPDPMYRRY